MLKKKGKRLKTNSNNDLMLIKQIIIWKKPKRLKRNLHIYFYFIVVVLQVNNGNNSKIYCVFFQVELCFNRSARKTTI
jgi:hypothetical protein